MFKNSILIILFCLLVSIFSKQKDTITIVIENDTLVKEVPTSYNKLLKLTKGMESLFNKLNSSYLKSLDEMNSKQDSLKLLLKEVSLALDDIDSLNKLLSGNNEDIDSLNNVIVNNVNSFNEKTQKNIIDIKKEIDKLAFGSLFSVGAGFTAMYNNIGTSDNSMGGGAFGTIIFKKLNVTLGFGFSKYIDKYQPCGQLSIGLMFR